MGDVRRLRGLYVGQNGAHEISADVAAQAVESNGHHRLLSVGGFFVGCDANQGIVVWVVRKYLDYARRQALESLIELRAQRLDRQL